MSNRATVEASSIIDSLQSTATVGFGYVDRDFRLLRLNSMLASVNGSKVEDQIGRKVAEVVPALWPTLEPAYRQVIDSGEAVVNQEVSGPTAMDPGRIHYWLTNFNPVTVGGDVIGIAVVVVDITERKQLEESHATLTQAVVSALSATVELRDPYTAGHQERVARIAGAVACELDLESQEIEAIELAARIHDIGKLSIPSELLACAGGLSESEMAVVRMHSQAGFDLLNRVHFLSTLRRWCSNTTSAAMDPGIHGVCGATRSSWVVGSLPLPMWSNRWRLVDRIEQHLVSTQRSTNFRGALAAPMTQMSLQR